MGAVWFRSLALAVTLGAAPAWGAAETLTVAAAASLRGAFDDLAELWDGDITVSYASSAALARQIEAGAPFDIYIAANTHWMSYLAERGRVDPASVVPIAGNSLVVVSAAQIAPEIARISGQAWPELLDALPSDARIAVGLTRAVPAGIYAREALESVGRFAALEANLVQVDNVRLALRLAQRGDTAAAIVYASDARAETGVAVIAEIPSQTHSPIVYPAARISGSRAGAGEAFVAFLTDAAAQSVLRRHGFAPPP